MSMIEKNWGDTWMGALGVVVVAAGKGSRMGTAESKQYLRLEDKPILVYALEVFQHCEVIDEIILVVGQEDVGRCRQYIELYGIAKCRAVVAGGTERQSSVYAGLQELSPDIDWVMVHDGVRPFVTSEQIGRLWEAVRLHSAAVLAVPVKDTVKVIHPEGWIESTPDRSRLWSIQTPQAFRLTELVSAHASAAADGYLGTDDAMLVERMGKRVHIVQGDYTNIKITTPEDLQWGAYLLKERHRDD
jgi:2-C-methyl-D-erythritol 4-phosphate cytidylyltransferase